MLKQNENVFHSFQLYEGYNTSAPLIGRYCGETSPSVYISDSSVISIKYKKTQASSYFSLSYEAGIFNEKKYATKYVI